MQKYIIGIDQSTQGTKALLFNAQGELIRREDCPHQQLIDEHGWVSHDPEEIYRNTILTVKKLVENSGIPKDEIAGTGISNQRETALIWEKKSSRPLDYAIVWQCARSLDICERIAALGYADEIQEKTGLKLSPYFPASKLAWILEHNEGAQEKEASQQLCMGTMDTWLIYKLTKGTSYKTDYSNASRTQLFHIHDLKWDESLCNLFGIHIESLPEVCSSDSYFGETDFEGLLPNPVPIHAVLGDSHAALFGQGCLKRGMIKATYGTGSSIMMNTGSRPVKSRHGVVTSLAWKLNGTVQYVLEGNINYTGAVISWLKDEVQIIQTPKETEKLCLDAARNDELYFVPAFTGLGAPHWDSRAKGMLYGITRTTRREEIVRCAVESIGYQIADIVKAMEQDAGIPVQELAADGGPTRNQYLMQFQSDILQTKVSASKEEEMSGIGAAYAAGIGLKVYTIDILNTLNRESYTPELSRPIRDKKMLGWADAVGRCKGS